MDIYKDCAFVNDLKVMAVKVLCKQMASLDFKYWSVLQLYATKIYIKRLQMCN